MGAKRDKSSGESSPEGSEGQSYRVTSWTAEDGLPQNTVRALAQTPDGYLWLGTLNGLARFDGIRFSIFDHSNTPEMIHDAINDLAVDAKDGSLWIGVRDGLLHYKAQAFSRYAADHGFSGTVGILWAAREGGVWLDGGNGILALVRAGQIHRWQIDSGDRAPSIQQVSDHGKSGVLILAGGRLRTLDPDTGAVTPFEMPITDPEGCWSFLEDDRGALWLCSRPSIWRKQRGEWAEIVKVDAARGEWIQRIQQTSDGQYWAIHTKGLRTTLRRLVDGQLEPGNLPGFPPDSNVNRLLEDREGNLWMGSSHSLFRLQPQRLKVLSSSDGLRNDDVMAVAAGQDGAVWLGTANGLSAVRGGEILNFPSPHGDWEGQQSLNWGKVQVFLPDSKDRLWIGYRDRLFSLMTFSSNHWERVPMPAPELLDDYGGVESIYEDAQQRIWIGGKTGVLCWNQGNWTVCATTANGLAPGGVKVIHQDIRGDMWFGVYGGGLNRLQAGAITVYQTEHGNYNNRAWHIHEDSDGVFWVGSQNGLNRFIPPGVTVPEPSRGKKRAGNLSRKEMEANRFFTFSIQHGLRENVVNNIQEDEFGYLWLSGLKGIYRISREHLNEVASGKRKEVECAAYGEADGMLSSECNGGDNQPAGCKDQEGRIWFPTSKGVIVLDPKTTWRNDVPPPVVIEQVTADDEIIYGDGRAPARAKPAARSAALAEAASDNPNFEVPGTIRLAPGRARVLKIRYTANSFAAPERLRFKYQLEGLDKDWREARSDERVAVYTNLRPGPYTFRVKACNNHGRWNQRDAVFAWTLAPHFWQTAWFQVAAILTAIGGAAGLQAWRLKWQRRLLTLENEQALARERARIARDLHDELGARLTALAVRAEIAGRADQGHGNGNGKQLDALAGESRALAERMRDVIWAVDPQCDSLEALAGRLTEHAEEFLGTAGIRLRLDLPDLMPAMPLSADARHQLTMVAKEALHNVLKHSGASEVRLGVELGDGELGLRISDNGTGFEENRRSGRGLANMEQRIQALGGRFAIRSNSSGTTVEVQVPLNNLDQPAYDI